MDTCTNMELNLNEMEMVNGGTQISDLPAKNGETPARAVAALVSGAVSGSGMANGTYRPGGVMASAVGAAMGAFDSFVRFFFDD